MPARSIAFDDVLGIGASDKRLEVLRSVQQGGSISQAARDNRVSYKAAWQAVETLSNLAGVPLIEKIVGGAGGGGARLTAQGVALLRAADLLQAARSQALAQVRQSAQGRALDGSGLAAVGLRTSMRNQWPCTVAGIERSKGAVRVMLSLADGQRLAARITAESLQLLGLRPGLAVVALCKATAVTVTGAAPTAASQGVNGLQGQVARRSRGAGTTEVVLQLASGLSLVGFAPQAHGLKLHQTALAACEESAVVIALVG